MTALLEQAVARARELSPQKQDELALVLLRLTEKEEGVYQLTPEEEADLAEGIAEAKRGEFATEAEVEAMFAKYRR